MCFMDSDENEDHYWHHNKKKKHHIVFLKDRYKPSDFTNLDQIFLETDWA